jgi:hypothetical protein
MKSINFWDVTPCSPLTLNDYTALHPRSLKYDKTKEHNEEALKTATTFTGHIYIKWIQKLGWTDSIGILLEKNSILTLV